MIEDKIILGIDPGTNILGYGIIHVKAKKLSLINFGVIHLSKLETHPDKLKKIFSIAIILSGFEIINSTITIIL